MNIIESGRARGRKGRRVALALSTSLVSGLAAPALAQAPEYRNLDANGVDLTKGDFVMSFKEGSIGSGPAELALVRRNVTHKPTQWDQLSFRRTAAASAPS